MTDIIRPEDTHLRVIDQRIGAGIGGMDTVIRLYHIPSGILIEVPRIAGSQHNDREIAFEMLEAALTHPKYREEKSLEPPS